MFLPERTDLGGKGLEIKDEGEEDVHLDDVLAEDDLFELGEGQFVHSETDEVGEDGEESAVVLAVGVTRETSEDAVVGHLDEAPVSFGPIENLLHEYAFSVLALQLREVVLGMGVGRHFVLVEGVD